jgi:hypothetical protein
VQDNPKKEEATMTPKKRFLFGGIGALLPVIVSILTLDINAYLLNPDALAVALPGIIIRYTLLFFLGGFITYLHNDEDKPFKLVELGIAAPALISSLVAGHAVNSPAVLANNDTHSTAAVSFSIINSAYAESNEKIELAGDFFSNILKGVTGSVYSNEKPVNDNKYKELKANTEKLYSVIVTPENNVYEIKASAQATGKGSPGSPEYKFSIFINSTSAVLDTIKQVQYDFLHPTFTNKHVVAENAKDQFSSSYIGWGCLTSVDVTVTLKDGTSKMLDFNMCRSLGPEWGD